MKNHCFFNCFLKFSACNTFFHGPGAGICRRQLRSAKIGQVVQKCVPFLSPVLAYLKPLSEIASKIVFGALLATILVDFGLIFDEF